MPRPQQFGFERYSSPKESRMHPDKANRDSKLKEFVVRVFESRNCRWKVADMRTSTSAGQKLGGHIHNLSSDAAHWFRFSTEDEY